MSNNRDTDSDWKRIAADDPFWGVLSKDEYKKDAMDDKAYMAFMESGERYVANLFSLIHKHLLPNFAPKRVLDFGCGVGRLLIPFATRTPDAVGLDVAPVMLDLCNAYAKKAGLKNVITCESDDMLSRVEGAFDFINSYIVLQHIPPHRGYQILQVLLKKLLVGGVGSIQITYAKSRRFFLHEQGRARFYRRDGGSIFDILDTNSLPPEGTVSMFDYDLNQVMAIISQASGHPLIVLPTDDDDHLGVHFIFVKARD